LYSSFPMFLVLGSLENDMPYLVLTLFYSANLQLSRTR